LSTIRNAYTVLIGRDPEGTGVDGSVVLILSVIPAGGEEEGNPDSGGLMMWITI
jgi:hypothetical protein